MKTENITIIATIKDRDNINNISNEDFYKEAKENEDIYTTYEFISLFNCSENVLKSMVARVLEVSKSSFMLV